MIDVLYVLNVCDVPIVIVVLNVFLLHNVLYDPHVHNVIIVPDYFHSSVLLRFLFSVLSLLFANVMRNFFKNIFYDTRADRRAFAAIGCVIVFVIGVHCIMYTLGEDSDGGRLAYKSLGFHW